MIDLFYFNGLPVAVLGLGRSGMATAKALMAAGADVWAWDDNEDVRARAREAGVALTDLKNCNWDELTTLVISPGIPHRHPEAHPVAKLAREHDCEIVCDIELLGRAARDARFVGVTGTNGKSTTTALIGHIMQLGKVDVAVGGNIGVPALALDAPEEDGTFVLELSSYQLELILSITFDIAVLLNISHDHLERHGGLEGYVAAKRQIFHRQTKPRTAVIGIDDPICRGIYEELRRKAEQNVVPISCAGHAEGGVYVAEGKLIDDTDGLSQPVLDLREIESLPGLHNAQNAAAAYAACKAHGMQPPVIAASMRSFPGLPHRQELVAQLEGVRFINDSKATNADAAAKALACYDTIYWILGGRGKEGGLRGLEAYYPRIACAFLIGETAEAYAADLSGKVATEVVGDLESAVRAAFSRARQDGRPNAVVLLSPACASFDQFRDFEARGEAFRAAVQELVDASGPPSRPLNEGAFGGSAR